MIGRLVCLYLTAMVPATFGAAVGAAVEARQLGASLVFAALLGVYVAALCFGESSDA